MTNKLFSKKIIAILFVTLMLFSSAAVFASSAQSSSNSLPHTSIQNVPSALSDSSLSTSLSSSGSNITAYLYNPQSHPMSRPNLIWSLSRTIFYQNISTSILDIHLHLRGDANVSNAWDYIHYDGNIYNFSTIPVHEGWYWYNTTVTLPSGIPSQNFDNSSDFYIQMARPSPGVSYWKNANPNGDLTVWEVQIYAVSPRPTVTISTPQDSYDAGQNAQFSVSSSEPISSYEWYRNQTLISNESSLSYAFPSSGDYSITAVVQSDSGWVIHSNQLDVKVFPKLTLTVSSSSNPADSGQQVEISTSVSGGTGTYISYHYDMYRNSSLIDSGATPYLDYDFNHRSTYLIKYSVEDTNNNTVVTDFNQTINSDPIVSISSSQNPTDVGKTVEFTSSIVHGTSPDTYIWKINGKEYYTKDINVSFAESGDYTVDLTITDSAGYSVETSMSETVNTGPTVSASSNVSSADINSPIEFSSTPSGGVSPYTSSWTIDGTQVSTSKDFSHSFSSPGSYTVQVTVTDSVGETASSSVTVTINDNPSVRLSSSQNPTDVGNSVKFTSTETGGTGTISSEWYINGVSEGSGSIMEHSFGTAGTYTIQVVVTDSDGHSASYSINEIVNSDPIVSISSSQNPTDIGLPVEFKPIISGGSGPFTVEWTYNGTVYTTENLTLSFSSSGIHVINLKITDINGNSASATFSETVHELPSVLAKSSTSSVDTNIDVNFTSVPEHGMPPYSFTWLKDGSYVSSTQNFSMAFSTPGTYTLEILIKDSLNVSASDNITIIVNQNPVVTISVPVSHTDANVSEKFSSMISGGTGPFTFEWFKNNILVSTSSSYIFNSSSPGTFSICLIVKDSDGRIADSNTLSEIVVSDPIISLSFSQSPIVGESVTIYSHISGGLGDFSLQWVFQSGSASGRNVSYSFSVAGNRAISIKLTDKSGYTTIQHFTVSVMLQVEISETSTSGDAPLSVSFSGTALGGSSYIFAWNFGNGNTSYSQTPTNIFGPGNYTVTLKVTDSSGVTGSSAVYIHAWPSPVKFIYSNNENITYDFHFKALPNWDIKAPHASWTMPNGQVLYGMNISYVFPIYSSLNTIYVTITYNSTSLYGGDSYSTSIIVHMKPANIKVIFTPPSYIPTETMLDMNASASAPDSNSFTFSWLINGASYSGNNTDYYFASAGVYYVNLTVSDSLGATTSISRSITVQSTGSASSIKISISTKTVGSYYYYTITVNSIKNISNVEAFLSRTMLHIQEISGNNTHQIYNLTLNQRNYNSGTFTITVIAYNVDGGSNSQTADFSVTSKYSSSSSLNIVQFFGGIGNTLEIFASLGSIIAGYLYFRKRGTTVIQEPGGYEEVGRPGKPLILEKKVKK